MTAQLWGGNVELSAAKNVTAAAWSVEVKKRSYRTDGTYREVGALIRGAAAGIGRGVESTGVLGWMTGDRLRQVWLIFTTKH